MISHLTLALSIFDTVVVLGILGSIFRGLDRRLPK